MPGLPFGLASTVPQAGLEFNFARVFGEQRQAEMRAAGLVAL